MLTVRIAARVGGLLRMEEAGCRIKSERSAAWEESKSSAEFLAPRSMAKLCSIFDSPKEPLNLHVRPSKPLIRHFLSL